MKRSAAADDAEAPEAEGEGEAADVPIAEAVEAEGRNDACCSA